MSYANQDQSAGDPGPVVFVLFGATGDLARRLVLPAFFRLAREGLLPRQWLLVGNGRGDVAHEGFRAHVHDALTEFGPEPGQKEWNAFAERVFFAGGGFSTDSPGSLPGVLGEARRSLGGDPQLIHYLAVPPVAFAGLTTALDQHGLCQGARVVYEKPFGTSGASFRELDRSGELGPDMPGRLDDRGRRAGLGDHGQVAGLRTRRQPHPEVSNTLPVRGAGRVPPKRFVGDQLAERRQAIRRGWRQHPQFLPAGQWTETRLASAVAAYVCPVSAGSAGLPGFPGLVDRGHTGGYGWPGASA